MSATATIKKLPAQNAAFAVHALLLGTRRGQRRRDCALRAHRRHSSRGIETIALDETVVASVVHEGPYEQMAESYASISAWIHEHGHRIAGPTREVYLNSPTHVAEDLLRTEIQFPIDAE
ncbi:MAG: GyrI-like domain-containing protein [Actinomycetota bacterium]|nr:GyrI-like domain-containing protein [Actinomycetota bacterium]